MLKRASASSTGRRGFAAAAALSLGLAGVVMSAGAATAAPVAGPVDDSIVGSLTLHKHAYPADGAQNPSGTGDDPTSEVIEGVTFEVCEIGNVTSLAAGSNLGWSQVNGLNALSAAGGALSGSVAGADGTTSFGLSNCTTGVTDAAGQVVFDPLNVGAYLVTETATPAGVIAGDPFVVTVPTPADDAAGADNTGLWEYDVNVYPKNLKATTPVKEISTDQPDNGVVLGDEIDFRVSQTLPGLPAGQEYTKVIITDTLDDALDYQAGSAVVSRNGVALTEGTDYTLSTTGDVIVVTLTGALSILQAGDVLTVDFTTTANAAGSIDNTAYVNVNDLDLDGDGTGGETPTPEVTTRWGNLLGEKTDATGTNRLGGAQFAVYLTSDTDGTCGPVTTADLVGSPVTTVTSAADGSIALAGLWVGDTNDDVTDRCYILQETVAPAGFVLPSGDAALTAVNVQSDSTVTVPSFAIENDQQLVPGLPLTGSDGQLMLTVAGVALAGAAVGGALFLAARKRREQIAA